MRSKWNQFSSKKFIHKKSFHFTFLSTNHWSSSLWSNSNWVGCLKSWHCQKCLKSYWTTKVYEFPGWGPGWHKLAAFQRGRKWPLEVNDTLKPSHRWTNGPLPLKTIEANGWRTPKPSKNHWNQWSGGWKSFNGDGWVTPKPSKNNWKQWSVGWKTLNGNG